MPVYFYLLEEIREFIAAWEHFFFFENFDFSCDVLFEENEISVVRLVHSDVHLLSCQLGRFLISKVQIA